MYMCAHVLLSTGVGKELEPAPAELRAQAAAKHAWFDLAIYMAAPCTERMLREEELRHFLSSSS
jgi:hypothetical protein